eukprot:s10_g30.t2
MSVVRLLICGVLELKALGQTFVGPVIWPLRTGRKCAYLFSRFVGANGNTSTRSYRSERKERVQEIKRQYLRNHPSRLAHALPHSLRA